MTFTEAVIERINELCELNHLSTNKLSELSTVPATTLYALLYDKVENPSSKNIYKFCKVFGITMKEFYDTEIFNKMDFKANRNLFPVFRGASYLLQR